jgi:endogenous inhibitor of DNA gyrase (YacG/DUF329 family)
METKSIKINCPKCKTRFDFYQSPSRPFCSERCKQVDLGQWLNEEYSVASNNVIDFDQELELNNQNFVDNELAEDLNWQ